MRSTPWRIVLGFVAALIAITSFGPPVAALPTKPPKPVHGIDPRDMDLSVDPAEDFYRFANGGWLDRTEIPADEGAYGVFNELDDLTTAQLLDLLSDLAAGERPPGRLRRVEGRRALRAGDGPRDPRTPRASSRSSRSSTRSTRSARPGGVPRVPAGCRRSAG